ncbi:molybdate ABC transporter substrate-binding protein [Sagittula sp. S175]|uniref:molybdate ABC transporter substrate-binding protein n=1 Tax=Sagittula sp. S175 TaxID=3415129 RepID=UPI003C7B5723
MKRLVATLSLLIFATAATAGDITVFAAASLRNALDEIADAYKAETSESVVLSYAASSALARQLQHGAPADLFISANTDWMDVLEAEGLLAEGTRRDLLGNKLVLISAQPGDPIELSQDTDLVGLLQGGRLAMALVDAVPAGIYGKTGLETLNLWQSVSGHVAQADNVRAALSLVSSGAAPYGIVYATDARAESNVYVRSEFPENSHSPIVYPVAAMKGREQAAGPFLAFLGTDTARSIFEANGFEPMEK